MRWLADVWYARIATVIVLPIAVAFAAATLLPGENAVIVAQSVLYGSLAVVTVGMELARTRGSAVTSGIVPTRASARLAVLGLGWAAAMLAIITAAGLVAGYRFVSATDPLNTNVFSSIILFAIGEELLFRGTVLDSVRERFGGVAAIVSTSVLFAVAHAGNPAYSGVAALNVFVVGLGLAWVTIATSSMWTSIAFHVAWNLASATFFGALSGNEMSASITRFVPANGTDLWLVSGPFGIEEGVLTSFLLLIGPYFVVRTGMFDPFVSSARLRRSYTSLQS